MELGLKQQKQEEFLKRIKDGCLEENEKTQKRNGKMMLRVGDALGVLDSTFINTLFNYLSQKPHIIGINFNKAKFSRDAASQLAKELGENTVPLRCISFQRTIFEGDSRNEVINSLASNNTLRSLRIDARNFQMSDNDEDLTRILKDRKNITLLRIRIPDGEVPKEIENSLSFNILMRRLKTGWVSNSSSQRAQRNKKKMLLLHRLNLTYKDMKMLVDAIPKHNILLKMSMNLSCLDEEKQQEIKKEFQKKKIDVFHIKRKRRKNNIT